MLKSQKKYSIYFSNNEKILSKCIFASNIFVNCLSKFDEMIAVNRQDVIFPLRFISNKKENRVKIIYLLLIEELNEKKVIKSEIYFKEEKFFIYGLKKRLSCKNIITDVFTIFEQREIVKIYLYKNKIVLDGEKNMECILCKNIADTNKLYFFLKESVNKFKLTNFLFLNHIPNKPREMKTQLIDKLVTFTGLSRFQFSRNSTRH